MARYSKQRETIKEILMSTTAHPTAAEIHREAQKVIPNISLSTVYRNLEALNSSGTAQTIELGDFTHFDGNALPHAHFGCVECGKVCDLSCDMEKFMSFLGGLEGCKITGKTVLVRGVCRDCIAGKITNNK